MDKTFPESGRLSNLCTLIGLFSLKIRKSSAESGRVGSSDTEKYFEKKKEILVYGSKSHIVNLPVTKDRNDFNKIVLS